MTERTYTLKDMARAWEGAYAWGWHSAWAQEWGIHRRDIGPLPELRAQQLNPYEQEEEGTNDDEGMQRSGVQEEV